MSRSCVHGILCAVLLSIVATVATDSAQAADALRVESDSVAAAHARIYRALDAKVSLEFIEMPLGCAVEYFKDLSHIEIQLDRKALETAGVATDSAISNTLADISLRSALNLLLRDLNLTYVVENEVLLITTPERASNRLQIRVYRVTDLAAPHLAAAVLETRNVMSRLAEGTDAKPDAEPVDAPEGSAGRRKDKGMVSASFPWYAESEYDELTNAITDSVAPKSWDRCGGPGTLSVVRTKGLDALVISQTREVHEQIEALLATLRKVCLQKK